MTHTDNERRDLHERNMTIAQALLMLVNRIKPHVTVEQLREIDGQREKLSDEIYNGITLQPKGDWVSRARGAGL